MRYQPSPPNLLPTDPATGGQALLVGWFDAADALIIPTGLGVITLQPDGIAQTAQTAAGVAAARVPVTPGAAYTFAADVTDWVAVSLRWVFADGTVDGRVTGYGDGRPTVTGVAPTNAVAVVCEVHAARARFVGNGDGTATVTYWDETASPDGGFYADTTPSDVPVQVSGATLVQGSEDPGALPPTAIDDSFGTRIYRAIPQVFRTDDPPTGYTLRAFLGGAGEPNDAVQVLVESLDTLVDPDLAPDAWVPWLAQATGVSTNRPLADVRALIQAAAIAPSVGTRAGIAALARQFLTGSKVADAFPGATPWQIMVRCRTDELPGTTDVLAAQMMATGQIPAGHYITAIAGLPTWSAVDGVMTWTYKGTWADVDSIGVTGSVE